MTRALCAAILIRREKNHMSTWPQWTWIVLAGVGLLIHTANNGEQGPKFNVVLKMIDVGVGYFILYSGGFFKPLFG